MMGEHRALIQATVVGVNDASILYPCCIQCYAKMLHDMHSNNWQCVRCSTSCGQSDLHWRYRLSLWVADSSASCNLVLFGGTLVQHFGCSADQFHEFLTVHQSRSCINEHTVQQAIQTALVGNAYIFCLKTNAPPQHSFSWQTLQTLPSISRPLCLADLLKLNTQPSQQQLNGKQSDFIAVQMIPTNIQDASGFLTVMDVLTELVERSGSACISQGTVSPESVECFKQGTSLRAGRSRARKLFKPHRISLKGKQTAGGEKNSSFRPHNPQIMERGNTSCNCSRCAMNCTDLSSLSAGSSANSPPSQGSVSTPQASAMFSCQSSFDQEFASGTSLTCSDSCLQSSCTNSQGNRSQHHIGGSGKEDRQRKIFDSADLLFEDSSTSMADFGKEQGSLMLKASCSYWKSGESSSKVSFGSSQAYGRTHYEHQNPFCEKRTTVDTTCKVENVISHVTNYSENLIDENNSAGDETVLADFSSASLKTDSDTHHSLYPSFETAQCENLEDQLGNKIQSSLNVSFKGKNSSFSTSINDSSLLLAAFEMNEHVPWPVKSDQPSQTANEQWLPGKGTEPDLCVTSRELSLSRTPVTVKAQGTTLSSSIEMPDSEDLSQFLNVIAGELALTQEQTAENVSVIPPLRLDVNEIETTSGNCQEKGSKTTLLCDTRTLMNTEVFTTNSAVRTIRLATATTRTNSATSTARSVASAFNITTTIPRSAFKSATSTTASTTAVSEPASTTSSTPQIQVRKQTVSNSAFGRMSVKNNSVCGSPVKSFPHNNSASSSGHGQSLTSVYVKHSTNYMNEPPSNHLCQQSLTHEKTGVPDLLDMPDSEDLDVFLNNLGTESKSCCASEDPQNCCLLVGNKFKEQPNSLNAGSVHTSACQNETVISESVQRKSSIPAVAASAQLLNSETDISVVGDSFLGESIDLFSSQSQLHSRDILTDLGHADAEHKNTTNGAISATSLSVKILSSDLHSNAGEVHHIPNKCSTAVSSQQSVTDNSQPLLCSPNVTTIENSVENDLNAISFSSDMSSFSDCARGGVKGASPSTLSEQYDHRVYRGTSVAELPKKVRFLQKRRVSSVKKIDLRLEKYSNPNGKSHLPLPVQLGGNLTNNTPQRSCLRRPLSLVLTPTNCRTVGNNSESEKKERSEQCQCATPSRPRVSRQSFNSQHCEVYGTSKVAKTTSPAMTLPGPRLFCSTPCSLIPRAFTDSIDCSGSQDLFSPVLSEDQSGITSFMKATEMSRKLTPWWHDGTVNTPNSGMENFSHIMEKRLYDEREVLNRSKKPLSCGKKGLSSRRKNRLSVGRENVRYGKEERLNIERGFVVSGRRKSLMHRGEMCVREMSNSGLETLTLSCVHRKRLSFKKDMLSSGKEQVNCGKGSRFERPKDEELSLLAATALEPSDGHNTTSLLDYSMVLFESADFSVSDKESVFNGSDDLFGDDSEVLSEGKPPDPDQVSTPLSKMGACVNEANSTSATSRTSDLSTETKVSRRTELYSSFLMSPDLFSP